MGVDGLRRKLSRTFRDVELNYEGAKVLACRKRLSCRCQLHASPMQKGRRGKKGLPWGSSSTFEDGRGGEPDQKKEASSSHALPTEGRGRGCLDKITASHETAERERDLPAKSDGYNPLVH